MPASHRRNKQKPLFVTTSSCSGRFVLLEFNIETSKKEAKFYKRWHRTVTAEEVELALSEYPETKNLPLWFKVEPFIFHVAAKDLNTAKKFLETVRKIGIKRGGIQTVSANKIMIEIQGTGYMAIPTWAINGEWTKVIDIGNEILERNFKMLKKMEKVFESW